MPNPSLHCLFNTEININNLAQENVGDETSTTTLLLLSISQTIELQAIIYSQVSFILQCKLHQIPSSISITRKTEISKKTKRQYGPPAPWGIWKANANPMQILKLHCYKEHVVHHPQAKWPARGDKGPRGIQKMIPLSQLRIPISVPRPICLPQVPQTRWGLKNGAKMVHHGREKGDYNRLHRLPIHRGLKGRNMRRAFLLLILETTMTKKQTEEAALGHHFYTYYAVIAIFSVFPKGT